MRFPSGRIRSLGRIWTLERIGRTDRGSRPIDVAKHGFFKVLGKGLLPKVPIVVKARSVSAIAEKKIKAAGGAVILTA